MTQAELNQAVAHATGEPIATIAALGFSVADPLHVAFDPEPLDRPPRVVDWDALETERDVVFPVRHAFAVKHPVGCQVA